jgi:imidazolonepropionase-like amidohydrolase
MALWTPPAIWADIRASLKHPERIARYGQGVRYADAADQEMRFKQLWQSGIGVRVGTDAGGMYILPTEGMWEEMELMVDYGVSPQEVIAAATRRNAEWLNMLDQLGTITEGKLADIIVVDGNPLETMSALRHIVVVVKDGKVVKGAPVSAPTTSWR